MRITADPLEPLDALAFVSDPGAGATCLFTGTVRDHSDAGPVDGLAYEAWDEAAPRTLEEIADALGARWPLRRVALLHRTGDLAVGEVSVIVACSAPHRAEAFEACREGIERIKRDLAVWKKEALTTGQAHWVAGS